MTGLSYIHHYAETLADGSGRAIMRRDVVIDGVLQADLSGTEGSPAPLETVQAHETKVTL